jgi:hypothetical protein
MASEIGNIFRKQLGDQEFSKLLAKCQSEKDKRKQRRIDRAKVKII